MLPEVPGIHNSASSPLMSDPPHPAPPSPPAETAEGTSLASSNSLEVAFLKPQTKKNNFGTDFESNNSKTFEMSEVFETNINYFHWGSKPWNPFL